MGRLVRSGNGEGRGGDGEGWGGWGGTGMVRGGEVGKEWEW